LDETKAFTFVGEVELLSGTVLNGELVASLDVGKGWRKNRVSLATGSIADTSKSVRF